MTIYQVKCTMYARSFDEGLVYGYIRGAFTTWEKAEKAISYLENVDKFLPAGYAAEGYWIDTIDVDSVITIIPHGGFDGGFDKKSIPIEDV